MSYTPTTWETGDVITAEKLNNMESGIEAAGGVLKVGVTENEGVYTLDKTAGELLSALSNGEIISQTFSLDEASFSILYLARTDVVEDAYYFYFVSLYDTSNPVSFSAIQLTDYPSMTM